MPTFRLHSSNTNNLKQTSTHSQGNLEVFSSLFQRQNTLKLFLQLLFITVQFNGHSFIIRSLRRALLGRRTDNLPITLRLRGQCFARVPNLPSSFRASRSVSSQLPVLVSLVTIKLYLELLDALPPDVVLNFLSNQLRRTHRTRTRFPSPIGRNLSDEIYINNLRKHTEILEYSVKPTIADE